MRELINGSLNNVKIINALEDICFILMIAPPKKRKEGGRKEGRKEEGKGGRVQKGKEEGRKKREGGREERGGKQRQR